MKEVRVEDAVGMVLGHDVTRIVPGVFKGVAFAKGHRVRPEDIPVLLDMGKAHLYVMELQEGQLHEEEAAQRMQSALGAERLLRKGPHEGKISLLAPCRGMVKVDEERLLEVNLVPEIVAATRKNGEAVEAGQAIASLRVVPLVIAEDRIAQVEAIVGKNPEPVLDVLPFRELKAGIVCTGSEVVTGRIQDAFGPVLQEKISAMGGEIIGQRNVGDDAEAIESAIREWIGKGCDLVLATGGMSVDPDDRTPGAISRVADEVVTYGMPILPGSMMMAAYCKEVPIFGLPGSVIYERTTAFDLLLPYVFSGVRLTRRHIVKMGHGGLLK